MNIEPLTTNPTSYRMSLERTYMKDKKPKYKVHVWKADEDNTELVFEAPAKPTLEQLYKLIG